MRLLYDPDGFCADTAAATRIVLKAIGSLGNGGSQSLRG
jgi:hypothetical protein